MTKSRRVTACLVLLAGGAVATFGATFPARADQDCRDIEHNYELIKTNAVAVQTNLALFAAADSGCEDLGPKLIAAGASVLARDRLGSMPLAHAAGAGRDKLVEMLLADNAPIDARNLA